MAKISRDIREARLLGRNGAALAAFGEIEAGFFPTEAGSLGERKEGVKLGESTFNVFLSALNHSISALFYAIFRYLPGVILHGF